jgi:hypothetical protein
MTSILRVFAIAVIAAISSLSLCSGAYAKEGGAGAGKIVFDDSGLSDLGGE